VVVGYFLLLSFAGLFGVKCYTSRVLMKPLHSKTASKTGSSLWIPAGRGAHRKNAKTTI
jgi:hypothetical protein